ncbi:glucan biosynthesis protein G [Aliishimia ponticola]|uniref:Glucan biosynthesis protein G n=1 Tax=Aliishimia ponticola TaxID=2499833 RepID=A0A4S4ND73_9RHOB|nr:glucan biosynthesis protein G [Aliishimia ponticola]THH35981.1 glucan biosynthesis protein G [Aliishimia ponticola]
MLRREFLMALAALAASPGLAQENEPGLQAGASTPFSRDDLMERARQMAQSEYTPRGEVPEDWRNLTYDQYRQIWFDSRNALWEGTALPQRLDVFPPGLYFPRPVEVHVVEGGEQRPLRFDMGVFDTTDQFPDLTIDDSLGYSGLRLRADLLGDGNHTEYAVFQGASYFRGIGTGENYGLSARGLALRTGDPQGEEFPDFVAFWIETPAKGAPSVTLHALLDSPSCTGLYTFVIRYGETLMMDITASLFARVDLTHVGIAPLTSMFLFDQTNRDRFSDFRPAVHDSDGLLIHNGDGEVIWRPLANPETLQISAFGDNGPRGFGLMQRARRFSDFNDLEAHYHNRPGVWITPGEDWGQGSVALVEIPADKEIYDNIVAYWRPAGTIPAGARHDMSYRLDWGDDPAPRKAMPLRVTNTSAGGSAFHKGLIFVIDFQASEAVPEDLSKLMRIIRTTAGTVSEGVLQRNPETGGPRLAFEFDPQGTPLAEFRVQLRAEDGTPLSEVWLYRWTQDTRMAETR